MFEYAQRATSQEYRDNWDRIWGSKESSAPRLLDPLLDKTFLRDYSLKTGCIGSDSGHHCSCYDKPYMCCMCGRIPENGEV